MNKKKKIVKYLFQIVAVLAVLLTGLNLFLGNRLEKYLKKELGRRMAEATDGFYNLSFDNLSIGLLKGELKIEGIRLMPDSAVFRQWKAIDSLPRTYVKADIGMIDFKGVNLIWRWSYKELYFHSFEIQKPRIQVFDAYFSDRMEEKPTRHVESKTLYEVMSPYINVLGVQTLNLSDASVIYTVESPVTPIVYGLDDVSFRAYGFLLDKNSSQSGKLLYSDNFEFVTNRPQTLLVNNDFILETDSIKLSTQDSVVFIKKINLIPQDQVWKEKRQRPDSYVDAKVDTVEVKGIRFKRKDALNYLTARSVGISSSEIHAFKQAGKERAENDPSGDTMKADADSLVQALSLYDIISPILHSISVGTIEIGNASGTFSQVVKDSVEVYELADFNLRAKDFLIDSVAEEKRGLWYSRSIAFEATGIEGRLTARNHRFDIDRMALDTETGDFNIENIRLKPIAPTAYKDYLSASIDTVGIRDLKYDKGISAREFKIDRPVVFYCKTPSYANEITKTKTPFDPKADVENILNPLFRYLSIERINLNHAFLTLNDRSVADPVVYRLKDFNFYATRFLVNDSTSRSRGLFFTCDNFGFGFRDFDNYLPGKAYRLAVGKADFSTAKGILSFQDVKLIPQDSLWQKGAGSYVGFQTPLIRATGFTRLPETMLRRLDATSLQVESPDIKLMKKDGSVLHATLRNLEIGKIRWDSLLFSVSSIDLDHPHFHYTSASHPSRAKGKKESSSATSSDMYAAVGRLTPELSVGKLNVSNAVWDRDTANLLLEGLHIDTKNRTLGMETLKFDTKDLAIPLNDGFYTLKIGKIGMDDTVLDVENIHLVSRYPKMEFARRQPHHKDWFDVKVGRVNLSGIDLPAYFTDRVVRINNVKVENAELQNFKNKQIPVPPRYMPMIYSGLQKAPVKVDIPSIDVRNFSVIYEELSKKGTEPGKLFITGMNGRFTGFTNIVSAPDQYIRLDADGMFFGKGYFTATWKLPVDSLNDRFLLKGHLAGFDLTHLNGLITPLAKAKVRSGYVDDFSFSSVASSKGAMIDMLLIYDGLNAELMKEKDGELVDKKLLTGLVNLILKNDNPDDPGSGEHKPRRPHLTIERDPYHSTFNYIWQILRPALIESVGVSKEVQDVAKGVTGFFGKVKNFFHPKKKVKKAEITEQNAPDGELIPE